MRLDIIESRLKVDNDLPSDFHFHGWEILYSEGTDPQDAPAMKLVGGRCPLITRGKRKGKPNWRKLTDSKQFIVLTTDADRWCVEYESTKGKCNECVGSGKTVASCGVNGTTYRECSRCKGTGTPPAEELPEA